MEPNTFQTEGFIESGILSNQQSPMREQFPVSSKVLDIEMKGSIMMELIVDKLKLLNYERQLCNFRSPPWPRLHKFYFALPSINQNKQFLYFSSIVAWLFGLLGCQFAPPSEVDDPNVTCSKIMMELMGLGFVAPNWSPIQLKQGHGDAVCNVLDTLCSLVLDAIKYEFNHVTPLYQDEPLQAAPNYIKYNEQSSELYTIDEQGIKENYGIPHIIVDPQMSNDLNKTTTNSNILANKWKLDLECIVPHLRIVVVADENDWRIHLDQAKKLYEETSTSFMSKKTYLKRFEDDVMSSLEKLESHENFINQQFESLIIEYVAVKGRLVGVQEKHNQIEEISTRLTNEHANFLESLEQVKQKMVEKGNEISDLSPLLQMKAAMQRLRLELREMEVHIGVLEHSLLQVNIKQAKGGTDEAKGH